LIARKGAARNPMRAFRHSDMFMRYCDMEKSALDYSTLPGERRQAILRRLAEDGRVVAVALSREFGTSEDTIRRDLRDLASAGWCTRIYGGALSISPASTTLSERGAQVPAREAALARAAIAVVTHGDIVFIDAGSTNLAIARALPERQALTIVTNAPSIAAALVGRDGFDVLVIGGRLDHRSGGTIGARAVDEARRIQANLCFVGECTVTAAVGISAFDQEEAVLKEAMIQASTAVAVVATGDKFRTRASFVVAPTSILTHLVVEAGTDAALLAPFAVAGVAVHVAGKPVHQ
jgi:DeoR/GlpR family transcriptional regulator of sugar metabolism